MPEEMIEGGQNSRKTNSYGLTTLKAKDKLRQYDFVKLREKDIKVKIADIKKVEESINKMREAAGVRRLQKVEEVTDEKSMKYVDSECDLTPNSMLKECKFTWDIVQSKDQ
jgi:hypothetical protein